MAQKKKTGREVMVREPTSPMSLMALALKSKANVDIMEKVSALADKWKKDMARDTFFRELTMLQEECPPITKYRKVLNKPERGGGVRYSYAPYEHIKKIVQPYMTKHGFSHTVKPKNTRTQIGATVVLHHIAGHEEESTFLVPIDKDAYMNDQQKVAAALSFSTRYAFIHVLGLTLVGEDTDANGPDVRMTSAKEAPLQTPKAVGENEGVATLVQKIDEVLASTSLFPAAKAKWGDNAYAAAKRGDVKSLKAMLTSLQAIAAKGVQK